jgi:pectate lyase
MARNIWFPRSTLCLLPLLLAACGEAITDNGADVPEYSAPFNSAPAANPAAPGSPAPAANTAPANGMSNGAAPTPGSMNENRPAALPLTPAPVPPANPMGSDDDTDDDTPPATQPPAAQPPAMQPPAMQPPQQQPPAANACRPWPAATGARGVGTTISVTGTFDGGLARFTGTGALANGSQEEGQDALFELEPGATLRNVILGNPAADGIHCRGACTLENVWWEDVGEDAATFRGNSDTQQQRVSCAGARNADDKVLQQNGAGTLTIENFFVEDFGKLYRSCGNCSTQFDRHVVMRNITASGGGVLVGINSNLGDTATFSNITLLGNGMTVCDRYNGNDNGDEPTKAGSGADGRSCIFTAADIIQR